MRMVGTERQMAFDRLTLPGRPWIRQKRGRTRRVRRVTDGWNWTTTKLFMTSKDVLTDLIKVTWTNDMDWQTGAWMGLVPWRTPIGGRLIVWGNGRVDVT